MPKMHDDDRDSRTALRARFLHQLLDHYNGDVHYDAV